jgi:hypothetical protein
VNGGRNGESEHNGLVATPFCAQGLLVYPVQ